MTASERRDRKRGREAEDEEKMRKRKERVRGRDEKTEAGERMDSINERDMSLETGGCSSVEASPKQTCFLYDDTSFKSKQTNKHPRPDADGKKRTPPPVKGEKLLCFYREREREI